MSLWGVFFVVFWGFFLGGGGHSIVFSPAIKIIHGHCL